MVLRTVKIIKPVIEVEVIICSQMCCTFNYNTQKINVTNFFFYSDRIKHRTQQNKIFTWNISVGIRRPFSTN